MSVSKQSIAVMISSLKSTIYRGSKFLGNARPFMCGQVFVVAKVVAFLTSMAKRSLSADDSFRKDHQRKNT